MIERPALGAGGAYLADQKINPARGELVNGSFSHAFTSTVARIVGGTR